MKRCVALLALLSALACESGESEVPAIVANPGTKEPVVVRATPDAVDGTRRAGDTEIVELPPEMGDADPTGPAPWPPLTIVAGRYSVDFAEDYVTALQAERAAFDAEMTGPREPPKTDAELKHRRIKDRGRRERLMKKPGLETITDEQISDWLSFNPDAKSAAIEWPRLLEAHPEALGICVDHARWLNFRGERSPALAEYTRCLKTPGITEDQMRFVTTQINAVKASPLPGAKRTR